MTLMHPNALAAICDGCHTQVTWEDLDHGAMVPSDDDVHPLPSLCPLCAARWRHPSHAAVTKYRRAYR